MNFFNRPSPKFQKIKKKGGLRGPKTFRPSSPFWKRQSAHLLLLALLAFLIWAAYSFWSGSSPWQELSSVLETSRSLYQDGRWLWIVKGLWNTIQITLLALGIGVLLGLLLSLLRMLHKLTGKFAFLNTLANLYITVIRGTPVTVQLLIIYFGVFASIQVAPVLVASLAFGLNSAAYVAEIFRAGIESIDKGQTEAGLSLGLSPLQVMWHIVMPQAYSRLLPTLFNELIALLKETAVAGYVGVVDLTRAANDVRSKTWSQNPLYLSAFLYLLLVLLLTQLLSRLEKRGAMKR